MRGHRLTKAGLVAAALIAADLVKGQETWRGLALAPEHRCTAYVREHYRYPQSVEQRIISSMGGRIYGPYTGRYFHSQRETDIEHMVATSEAHDSGLCAADPATKRRFASDLLNLTLSAPEVNRHQKRAKDAGEWLPRMNRCWFAARVVAVKRKYRLSVDRREARALEGVLARCTSTEMVMAREAAPTAAPTMAPRGTGMNDALTRWDTNGNGRITCKEAREHGIAPVPRGHPAYQYMDDRDGDGVVCE